MAIHRGLMLLGATLTGVAGMSLYGAVQVITPPRCTRREDPAKWGVPSEDVQFRAPDGTQISGWLARGELTGGPAIIVAHGHGASRHGSLAHAQLLYPRYSVLMPDHRAHGGSAGRYTSIGYHERLDLIGAARYLRELGYSRIGVLGISMGGAAAILAAAESPEIDAVVADSSFACLWRAVQRSACHRGYPGPITAPLAYLACHTAALRLRYRQAFGDPVRVVGEIAPRPLLIIHGGDDDLISADSAYQLYMAAGPGRELWILPRTGHARALEAAPEQYSRRVLEFYDRTIG
jgi:fermentation-respiration switch protein FrsA (DUF1100 family)